MDPIATEIVIQDFSEPDGWRWEPRDLGVKDLADLKHSFGKTVADILGFGVRALTAKATIATVSIGAGFATAFAAFKTGLVTLYNSKKARTILKMVAGGVVLGLTLATGGIAAVGWAGVAVAGFFAVWAASLKYRETESVSETLGTLLFEIVIGTVTNIIGFGVPIEGVFEATQMAAHSLWEVQSGTAIADTICGMLNDEVSLESGRISLVNPFDQPANHATGVQEQSFSKEVHDDPTMSEEWTNSKHVFENMKSGLKAGGRAFWDETLNTISCSGSARVRGAIPTAVNLSASRNPF